MKILVAVTQSAKLESKFEISDGEISDTYFTYQMNESDKYALEEAIQFAETSSNDVEVVCVTIGPARTVEVLNYALAMGANRAIRVWDEALHAMELLDPQLKAILLEAVVDAEGPNIVFTGVQSDDTLFGATGVYLAQQCGFGWSAAVSAIDFDADDDTVIVTRELEGGLEEVVSVDRPAVITVQAGINEPRYVSQRSVYRLQISPEEMNLNDLGLDSSVAANGFSICSLESPNSSTTYFEGGAAELGEYVASVLREKGVTQ